MRAGKGEEVEEDAKEGKGVPPRLVTLAFSQHDEEGGGSLAMSRPSSPCALQTELAAA